MSAEHSDRRRFLSILGACGLTAAATKARATCAAPAAAALHTTADVRSVSSVHTHTGERLTAEYFAAGRYQPDCLERVNHLLRGTRLCAYQP